MRPVSFVFEGVHTASQSIRIAENVVFTLVKCALTKPTQFWFQKYLVFSYEANSLRVVQRGAVCSWQEAGDTRRLSVCHTFH